MEKIDISNAKYIKNAAGNNIGISCTFGNKVISVPLDASNRHYEEILRQVEAGILTIAEAD